ncbi:AMP-binding protein [Hydrogenophilus thiooxidans]|uniref:AMP-binding protein n=1 Tax=Hydrogenophilus thiooxidans TaxID=2820326 RepID=UPI001C246E32|nr:AMP-binding protein [Hydrogenophilus thiooxidans]
MIITLAALVTHQAQRTPEQQALIETRAGARRLTYSQLDAHVTATAQAWQAHLHPGQRVLIWLDKRVETIIALLAANRLGALFIVANPALKPEQIAYLVHDARPSLIVTSTARADALRAHLDAANAWRPHTPPSPLAELAAPHERDSLLLLTHANPASNSVREDANRITENDPAAIFYTSGSTGFPKGVVVSHRNLLAGAQTVAHYLGLTTTDRILALLPLSFDAGFSQLTTAWTVGATVVLHDYFLPRDALAVVGEHQISVLTAVPPLWRQLLNLSWPTTFAEHFRLGASTGGKMPPRWVAEWYDRCPKSPFFVMYGLTEAFRATYLPPSEWPKRPESIGIPVPNNDVIVVREDGTRAPPGEIGEIVQRGPLVSLGYWNDPVKTQARFRTLPPALRPANGALPLPEIAVFSGDYGYCDDDGFLYFVGRRDGQIKTSGYRVSPEEIESVLLAHPAVVECCACGLDDPLLGQKIAVAVVVSLNNVTAADLTAHCRRHLATYQVPALIDLVTEPLPRNPNGKIDRHAVRQALQSRFCTEVPAN